MRFKICKSYVQKELSYAIVHPCTTAVRLGGKENNENKIVQNIINY